MAIRNAQFIPDYDKIGPYVGKTSWNIKMPELNIPKWDTAVPKMDQTAISGYKQQAAATGIRGLRNALRESITLGRGVDRDNPYAAQQRAKSAMSGFGSGLGNVMQSASTEALNRYLPEYQAQNQAAQQEYGARVQGALKEAELEMMPQVEQMKAEMAPYAKYLGVKGMSSAAQSLADQYRKYYKSAIEHQPGGIKAFVGSTTSFNPYQYLGYA